MLMYTRHRISILNIKNIKYRQVTRESTDKLCLALENEDWTSVCINTDPQEAYSCFYRKIYDKYNESIPLVSQSKKNLKNINTPWIPKGILISRRVKNKLFKNVSKILIKQMKQTKSYRNKFNKIKKAAKKKYYCEKLSWKLIKEIINKNKHKSETSCHFKNQRLL